ncbi:DUF2652 domain-containing protein [Croceitalea dokdonensis]|nr:DUF2652 domain-containing protein [Croceitalea dokdonensis]
MAGYPTLICIPDISGFTQFMSEAEFELSSKIIPSLLNKIIYSNEIGLKVSEIEGDSILFFKQGELPNFQDLIYQCKHFHSEFYKQLKKLRTAQTNKPGGDQIPKILGLKIILHYSNEIGMVPVGNHIKLMGEDVIVAHRLLKNKVPLEEYLLLSDDLLEAYGRDNQERSTELLKFQKGVLQIKHIGKIGFHYLGLSSPEVNT